VKKILLIKIIIAVVILFFLVNFIDYNEIISAFKKANSGLLLAGIFLFIPNIVLQLLKWRFLLMLNYPSMKLFEVVKSLFAGFSVGMITPGRIGEISRAFFIEKSNRVKVLGFNIIDKVYSLIITILFGLLCTTYIILSKFRLSVFVLIPVLMIAFFALFIILYFALTPNLFKSLVYNLNVMMPKREKMKEFLSLFDYFNRNSAVVVLLYSFVIFFTYITQFVLFINSFEKITVFEGFTASIATIFAKSLLPVSIGDLGIREGASVFFFSKFNVTGSAAFDSALLLFSVNVLLPAVIGFVLIISSIVKRKNKTTL